MSEDLQHLREIPIHTILGIKDNGRNIKVKCPFHGGGRERTPSLLIDTENCYKCFGCGIYGRGAIDFLLESGSSFQEVINELKQL